MSGIESYPNVNFHRDLNFRCMCGVEMMKCISTTIKKVHMDAILSGLKTIEYKGSKAFWRLRLKPLMFCDFDEDIYINFLCGRKSYKFEVIDIRYVESWKRMKIDENLFCFWFEIHLGGQIDGE